MKCDGLTFGQMLTISNGDGFTKKCFKRVNKERGLKYNQVGNKKVEKKKYREA